jgi:hypothetical chaperone protein
MSRAVGIDFGTTNSAIAVADAGERPRLARFAGGDGATNVFRSILHFDPERREPSGRLIPAAGPRALDLYREGGGGRLLQSLKSFLASRLFTLTSIYGTFLSLETLIGYILRALRAAAEESFGDLGARAIVGRPVRFADATTPEAESLALSRLRTAYFAAGFREIEFEYEPVAAAYHYELGLDHDELVLIADFGGGTSDFSLLRVGPGVRRARGGQAELLGTEGVALAGDAFDGRIVRHQVAPQLGRGSQFRSLFGRLLPVPGWIYLHLERWHHLAELRAPDTLHLLHALRKEAVEPERLGALLHVVENDLGFPLYRSVHATKLALSAHDEARFGFRNGPIAIDAPVARASFEDWIRDDLRSIEVGLDALLEATGVRAAEIDSVFLTGGSSLVPAVRRRFAERFGAQRLRDGEELTSVASGLALRALA